MNRKDLIKKSGLSFRQLLSLKNNHLDIKRNSYYKHRKVKPADSLLAYIFAEAKSCWSGVLFNIIFSLLFAAGDYYNNKISTNAIKVFFFMCIFTFIIHIMADKSTLRTNSSTVFKLILLRAMQVIYRVT